MIKNQTSFWHLRYIKPWGKKKKTKLLASNKFYAMVNSLFTQEWWCVKWLTTTVLEAKTLSSSRSNWTKYKKKIIVSAQNESHREKRKLKLMKIFGKCSQTSKLENKNLRTWRT